MDKITLSCTFFLSIVFFSCITEAVTYNVIDFGAKPDGETDATYAFLKAWASACNSGSGSGSGSDSNLGLTIYIPKGTYMINAAKFRGPCKDQIDVRIDGTLVAEPPVDYSDDAGNSGYWILFINVDRLRVIGGTLDGKGTNFWECKSSGQNCPTRARSITFNWANDIVIDGLTSINSQLMHLVINSCSNVKVQNVKIIAPALSPNTDGIHVQSSTRVTITESNIQTGDDCISIGPGTTNLWMDSIHCGPGHGVSIGSLGRNFNEAGVENVTLRNSVFNGSDNGLRIKTWARPSNGFVRNIHYQNITMNNVGNPIIIDQNYCPNNQSCPAQSSGIEIEKVWYENIQGTSTTEVAMIFDCSPSNPCRGIKLQDVKLTYMNRTKALSVCNNIGDDAILPDTCL
ncbi:polygalacturonase-like [Olea europaea subsp. europaea]|uniref:Polygalacturonase-like n=1 Tax=Olea europaea subsp. europaea TaxID=158383 RepID=A0A8S0PCF3_OLEEU|nr:polygalacturonase-like [Olea europaea subsp. europaea]